MVKRLLTRYHDVKYFYICCIANVKTLLSQSFAGDRLQRFLTTPWTRRVISNRVAA